MHDLVCDVRLAYMTAPYVGKANAGVLFERLDSQHPQPPNEPHGYTHLDQTARHDWAILTD